VPAARIEASVVLRGLGGQPRERGSGALGGTAQPFHGTVGGLLKGSEDEVGLLDARVMGVAMIVPGDGNLARDPWARAAWIHVRRGSSGLRLAGVRGTVEASQPASRRYSSAIQDGSPASPSLAAAMRDPANVGSLRG
jgi:hypothetical protein